MLEQCELPLGRRLCSMSRCEDREHVIVGGSCSFACGFSSQTTLSFFPMSVASQCLNGFLV